MMHHLAHIWHTFGTWWLGAAFFFAPLKVLGRAWIFSTGTGRALEKYCTKSHERWLDTSLVVGQQRWATSLGNIVATENLTAPKRSQKGSLALEARWPIHNWPISTATCHTEKRLQLRLCWFILFILFLLSKNSKSSFGIRWCNMMQHTVPVMPLAAPHWIHHSPRSIFNLCCFAAVLVALQSAKLRHCVLLMCFTVFHCVSLCFTVFHWKLLNSLDSFNPIDSAPCSESTVLHVPLSVWHHWIRRVSLFATILVTGESSFNGQPPPEIHKGSGVTGFLATVSSVPKPRVWSDYFLPSPEKSENQEVQ